MFERELDYFMRHQPELVQRYGEGQVLVIRGEEVVGAFDDALTAYLEASKKYRPGTFMVQPCRLGPGAYTATISSAFSPA